MTEIAEKNTEIFNETELHEMFNPVFLPKLQEFARRVRAFKYDGKELEFFNVQMLLQFKDLENPLSYQDLDSAGKIEMRMFPVTKEDLEREKENAGKDLGDS